MTELINLLKGLSEPLRLRMVFLLTDGERNVSEVQKALGLPQPNISHHLGILLSLRFVKARRRGKEVFYSLNESITFGDNGLKIMTSVGVVKIAESAMWKNPGMKKLRCA